MNEIKRIKRWRRVWKVNLINKTNPDWLDITTDKPFGMKDEYFSP